MNSLQYQNPSICFSFWYSKLFVLIYVVKDIAEDKDIDIDTCLWIIIIFIYLLYSKLSLQMWFVLYMHIVLSLCSHEFAVWLQLRI